MVRKECAMGDIVVAIFGKYNLVPTHLKLTTTFCLLYLNILYPHSFTVPIGTCICFLLLL